MAELLWTPSADRVQQSQLSAFMKFVASEFGVEARTYDELWQWSVTELAAFWTAVWRFCDIRCSTSFTSVIDKPGPDGMPGAKWFTGARLNFAENLLRFRDDRTALIFKDEVHELIRISYAQLYGKVSRLATSLRAMGVRPGDRVAAFLPNMPEAIIAMLASTSVGAIWSSCSPDFGLQGVKDRFGQIQPRVLFAVDAYWYKGKKVDCFGKLRDILNILPSVQKAVLVPFVDADVNLSALPAHSNPELFDSFLVPASQAPADITFEQLPFDHPVYIMYSSGTTGLPKCMVQGAGVLLNHMKEQRLHCDLRRDDVLFYFTTCGWMMWNWLASGLATGSTLVLFDGNPMYPDAGALWKLAEDAAVTIFGTSARFIQATKEAGVSPGKVYNLSNIRAILSTGSPLSVDGFRFVYSDIKADVQLSSISGGTDLNGCFSLGCPTLPVYMGELQCRGLGMKVAVYDDQGKPVVGQKGELVCEAPFPSMPLFFWSDVSVKDQSLSPVSAPSPKELGVAGTAASASSFSDVVIPANGKYHKAYFDVYPGVWRHGDFAELTERGGMVIYGRSDATLNPQGVRIGTAELYRYMEMVPEIADSVAIGQNWKEDVRVVLFVKLKPGFTLSPELRSSLVAGIRKHVSPRHVPDKILAVPDIPYTLNMKKVEIAVRQTVEGISVQNKDALINPECLEHFKDLPELQTE